MHLLYLTEVLIGNVPRALSQRFCLPILLENQNVATECFSLKMFS